MLVLGAIISVSGSLGYGLPAIIGLESMGVPSPGETALVLAAVLASQGKLQIWLVILIAACSAIAGDNLGYLLGRRFGREVLEAPGPFHHRRVAVIALGDRFFAKHGAKAVFVGRWIALVRFATAWLAGINEMRFSHFFFWNALGGISWAVTYGLVGYFAGSAAADAITKFGIYAAVLLALVVVGGFVYFQMRERRHKGELLEEHRREQEAGDAANSDAADEGARPAAEGEASPSDS
jgi:membrane protein DedA with SNARE-associated domain